MPLVANSDLPSFARLKQDGETILAADQALQQDIRELHIGMLNMMPDAALSATDRQFIGLVGASNQIAQFYVYPFTLPELQRGAAASEHVSRGRRYTSSRGDAIDHVLLSPDLADSIEKVEIRHDIERRVTGHRPIVVTLRLDSPARP